MIDWRVPCYVAVTVHYVEISLPTLRCRLRHCFFCWGGGRGRIQSLSRAVAEFFTDIYRIYPPSVTSQVTLGRWAQKRMRIVNSPSYLRAIRLKETVVRASDTRSQLPAGAQPKGEKNPPPASSVKHQTPIAHHNSIKNTDPTTISPDTTIMPLNPSLCAPKGFTTPTAPPLLPPS